jgi:enamine deaminase RidA (YjgF/YER057c/UK114 family)
MTLSRSNPGGLSTPLTYSHVVVATGSRVVFLAGQVALDANGNLVGGEDVVAQAEQVYRNIVTALDAAGAKPSDVAKLTTFMVGHHPELLDPIAAARRAAFGDDAPASTLVGVQALARPEYLIEVEAIAVLD